jgi:hypothetical protein
VSPPAAGPALLSANATGRNRDIQRRLSPPRRD